MHTSRFSRDVNITGLGPVTMVASCAPPSPIHRLWNCWFSYCLTNRAGIKVCSVKLVVQLRSYSQRNFL